MRTTRTSPGSGRARILTVSVLALLLGSVAHASADPPVDPPVPVPDGGVPADVVPGEGVRGHQQGGARSLTGTFLLDPGECAGPSGTYFRMAQPGGSPDEGPYVDNNDSPCDDSGVTPLQPGSDGGLITGDYQPHPDPAFSGNAGVADRIVQPQAFFGTDFAVATNPTDPQTGDDVPPPEIRVDGSGALSGDLRAFAAAWQTQHFNQGSPKPDGSTEGTTTPVTGTLDESTGRFVLEWSSQIEGGPFNNFTGVWHMEGVFRAASGGGQPAPPTTEPTDPSAGATPVAPPDGPAGTTAEVDASSPPSASGAAATGALASTGGSGLSWPAVALVALGVGAVALRARLRR